MISRVSFQAKALVTRATTALPQKVGSVTTQVKTERRTEDLESSEESSDSEEETAPAAPTSAQVGTREGEGTLLPPSSTPSSLLVGRPGGTASQNTWPVNQGASSSLHLHFLHRPNQLWKNRQRLPLGRAPPPPLHLPWLPLCK